MTKCSYCKKKIKHILYNCKYCHKQYCSQHRLPEDHKCEVLERNKKENKKIWQKEFKSEFSSNNSQHNFKENKHEPHNFKYKISLQSKIKKFLWKNKRKVNLIIKVIVILLILFIAINYYQNNKEEIKDYLKNFLEGSKQMFSDIISSNAPSHNISVSKSYPVNLNGVQSIELTLHQEVYDYYQDSAPHEYTYSSYSEYAPAPVGWEKDYWTMFLTDKYDEYIIEDIVNQVTEETGSEGDKAARTLIYFVQKIPYAWDTFNSVSFDVQYPYETLYLNKGVCAEKALLMAKLLDKLGYGIALFEYNVGDHMVVGIECPYDKSNYDSGYCFIESSDVYPIGIIPQKYVGGVDIRNEIPEIYIISKGKSFTI